MIMQIKLNDFETFLKAGFNTSFQALQRIQDTRPSASIGTNLFKFKTDNL